MSSPTPIALSIAGSDSSAGAGIQADLKTMAAHGVHALTALTCVVAETPLVVNDIHPIPPLILQVQISLMLKSYPVAAIKTGMLFSKTHIVAVSELLQKSDIPLVIDPVMIASTGDPLLEENAIDALIEQLLPLATVITPNLPEAGVILGRPVLTADEQEDAAHEIAAKFNCACYLKGGHLEENESHRDILAADGKLYFFEKPHLDLPSTHGTGCTLSAAFTAALALGKSFPEAAKIAHSYTHRALAKSYTSTASNGQDITHLDQLGSTEILVGNCE